MHSCNKNLWPGLCICLSLSFWCLSPLPSLPLRKVSQTFMRLARDGVHKKYQVASSNLLRRRQHATKLRVWRHRERERLHRKTRVSQLVTFVSALWKCMQEEKVHIVASRDWRLFKMVSHCKSVSTRTIFPVFGWLFSCTPVFNLFSLIHGFTTANIPQYNLRNRSRGYGAELWSRRRIFSAERSGDVRGEVKVFVFCVS